MKHLVSRNLVYKSLCFVLLALFSLPALAITTLGIGAPVAYADSVDGNVPQQQNNNNQSGNSNDLFDELSKNGGSSNDNSGDNSGNYNPDTSGVPQPKNPKPKKTDKDGKIIDQLPKGDDNSGFSDFLNDYKPVNKGSLDWVYQNFGPVISWMNRITATIIVAAMILISFSMAIDLLYINVPMLRNVLDQGEGSEPSQSGYGMGSMGNYGMGSYGMGYGMGVGGMGVSSSATTNRNVFSRIRWASPNAISAVKETEASLQMQDNPMNGVYGAVASQQQQSKPRSANRIYLGSQVWSIFWLVVCIVLLLGGKVFHLSALVIQLVLGIMNAIG